MKQLYSSGDWKFELRIRYLPTDLREVYEKDKITFCNYFDQVWRQKTPCVKFADLNRS